MTPEIYLMIGAIIGGLIGFVSSFFTTMLTQRYETKRRQEVRDWQLADRQRNIHEEILNRRYDEAEVLISAVMEEILKTTGLVYSAAKSSSADIKQERLRALFQLSEQWDQIEEFEQLHTIVCGIGDSKLISLSINLQITYNTLLEWIDKSLAANLRLDETLPITKRQLGKVDEFKVEAFEHYSNFYQRLDKLRSGASPEK